MCHVFYNHFRLSFFLFYMYVPCIFVYFNSTCHVSFVSLHACIKYLCFFTCLCNVSYYHSSCECRLFAKFLQNKLPYWHWCYWGDLVKKKKRKIKPIITFKQKYVSIIGYSPSPFFSLFTYFKVCQIQSAPWNVVCIKIVTCGVHALLNYIYILVHAILKLRILAGAQLTSKMMMNKEKSSPRSRLWVQNRAKFPWTIFKIMLMMIKIDQTKKTKTNTHDIQYVSNYMYVLYHSHKYLIIIWTEHSCQSTEESMFELLNFLFQNISYIFKYFSFSLILQKYSF